MCVCVWASVFLTNALKWKLTPRTVRFLYREISCSIHSTNFRLKDGPISQAVSTLIQQYFLSRSLTFCRAQTWWFVNSSLMFIFSALVSQWAFDLSLRLLRPNKLFRTMIIENDDILLKKWHDKLIHFPYTRCTLIHKHIHKIMCSMCAMCLNSRIWRCQKNRYGSGRRPSDVAVVAVAVKWEWVWRMEQRMDNGRSVKYLLNLFFMRGRTFVYICPVEATFIWFTHRLIMPLIDTHILMLLHLYHDGILNMRKKRGNNG